MSSLLSKYLNQPYPYYYEGKKLYQISCVFVVLAFIFNYFIQPFGVNEDELKMNYFWIALLHSLSPLLTLFIISQTYKQLPSVTENWQLKKELLIVLILLVFTGILQFLLRDIIYTNFNNMSWYYFIIEIKNTLLVGSFIAGLVISVNLNLQYIKNTEKATELNDVIKTKVVALPEESLFIETEVKSESFTLKINELVACKAEGNYVTLWIHSNGSTFTVLKRVSLKELENKLAAYPQLMKTHRSYLLNTQYIAQVSGNAQGYRVQLQTTDLQVPVSRNYLKVFDAKLKS